MISVVIDSVRINIQNQQRVVILKATGQTHYLFLWIGQPEAYAIAVELQHTKSPRPLTHDLLKTIIEGTGLKMREVRITHVEDEIFFAQIVLERDGQTLIFDSRPSDALALAVRVNVPILVAESILEKRGITPEQIQGSSLESGTSEEEESEPPL